METTVWDSKKNIRVLMPKEHKEFLTEIDLVCKKHNMSISHEDIHGGFIIEEYKHSNIEWLQDASKNY